MPFWIDVSLSICGTPNSSFSSLVYEYFIQDAKGGIENNNWWGRQKYIPLHDDKFHYSMEVITSGLMRYNYFEI